MSLYSFVKGSIIPSNCSVDIIIQNTNVLILYEVLKYDTLEKGGEKVI